MSLSAAKFTNMALGQTYISKKVQRESIDFSNGIYLLKKSLYRVNNNHFNCRCLDSISQSSLIFCRRILELEASLDQRNSLASKRSEESLLQRL